MLKQKLITDYDFLRLTCENQHSLIPFSFDITLESFQSDTLLKPFNTLHVSVIDSGIIEFIPVIEKPSNNQPSYMQHALVISCGVHGNETAPIEIVNHLIGELLQGKIQLHHRVLFIIANPYAINQQKRFIDENLNSVFSINKEQVSSAIKVANVERVRAKQIESTIIGFYQQYQHDYINNNMMNASQQGKSLCLHYDLHTAIRASVHEKFAIVPYLHNKPWCSHQLTLLDAFNVKTVLFANAPTPTLSYFASQICDALSLTIELGQVNEFGDNDKTTFNEVTQALSSFISLPIAEQPRQQIKALSQSFCFYAMHQRIIKKSNALTFNFANNSKNFTQFSAGDLLARDGEIAYYSDIDNEAILFPNINVPINQRALLTVKPITFDIDKCK